MSRRAYAVWAAIFLWLCAAPPHSKPSDDALFGAVALYAALRALSPRDGA